MNGAPFEICGLAHQFPSGARSLAEGTRSIAKQFARHAVNSG